MKDTYLIQRLQKPSQFNIAGKEVDNPFSFGGGLKDGGLSREAMDLLRGIFSFDYMGSAEFEWGAVPKALSVLYEHSTKSNLVTGQVVNGEEVVYYLTPKEYEAEVIARIKMLRDGKLELKERCMLDLYFDRPEHARSVGWLELDNGFMFFVDREMFDKTSSLFGISS